MRYLHRLEVENFLSLQKVAVDLAPLNVLVGPNGAGKSNLLEVIQFLGDTVRLDLPLALVKHGGYAALRFRGKQDRQAPIRIALWAQVTRFASSRALDEYTLRFSATRLAGPDDQRYRILGRSEEFKFKRLRGKGRRIQVTGKKLEVVTDGGVRLERTVNEESAGLSTLSRLGEEEGARQVQELGELFETFRVLDVAVVEARRPSPEAFSARLAPDASNLAAFLAYLARDHQAVFACLEEDLKQVVPGLRGLHLKTIAGAGEGVAVQLIESAFSAPTPLARASFGTVRALALLALLHDPDPPKLTCVEELDHGLHPHALDVVVDRLREAAQRTQLLVVTHSPALVNRLRPDELIVCERDPQTGASRIPAIDPAKVREMEAAANGLGLGELWFSGVLGGGL